MRQSSSTRTAGAPLRVFVAARVRLYRAALVQLLRAAPSVEVVGSADTGASALAGVGELEPDVVVLDVSSPGDLADVGRLAGLRCSPLVVAVGIPDSPEEIVACAEAGAAGFVTSSQSPEELVATVESVARGELPCESRAAAALFRRVGELARRRARAVPATALTPRELEIAGLVQRGLTNREIGGRLFIEPATVKNHVHSILAKLDARSREEIGSRLELDGRAEPRTGLGQPA